MKDPKPVSPEEILNNKSIITSRSSYWPGEEIVTAGTTTGIRLTIDEICVQCGQGLRDIIERSKVRRKEGSDVK